MNKIKKITTFIALLLTMGQLFISPTLAVADHIETTCIAAVSKEESVEQNETVPTEVKPFHSDELTDGIKRSAGLQSENARANDSPDASELPVVETIGDSLFILPSGTEVKPLENTEEVEVSGDFDERYTMDYILENAKSTSEQEEMLAKSEEYARLRQNFTRATGYTSENIQTINHQVWRNLPNGNNFLYDVEFSEGKTEKIFEQIKIVFDSNERVIAQRIRSGLPLNTVKVNEVFKVKRKNTRKAALSIYQVTENQMDQHYGQEMADYWYSSKYKAFVKK